MLKMPNIGGPDGLRLLLDDVPRFRHGELLGVSDRTLRRWLSGDSDIPVSAFQALFWHTRWGDSVIQSEYCFELDVMRGLADARGQQLARLAVRESDNDSRASVRLQLVR